MKKRKKESVRDEGLYSKYRGIFARCNHAYATTYNHYGGRGIKMEWLSYVDFRKDMYVSYIEHIAKHGYKDTTIDRVNKNGHYNKGNCKWSTMDEQSRNKRTSLIYKNECAIDASIRLGGQRNLVQQRLKYGWSKERAFNTKVKISNWG